jgi:hypothetical protein
LDLEALGEVVPAGFGLVSAAVEGPGHRGVNELFGLVADVEQASDLGEAQADQSWVWQ